MFLFQKLNTRRSCIIFHVSLCPPQPNNPIAGDQAPDKIVLGPVAFRPLPDFLDIVNRNKDLGDNQLDDNGLKYFVESAKKHGWVASVEIPSCAPDISQQRAENIIEAAINLLKIFIGLRHAKAIRLPHTAAVRNRETCVLREVNGKIEWTWHGRGTEGALVENDWFASIPQAYRNFASHLLFSCLSGKRSEATLLPAAEPGAACWTAGGSASQWASAYVQRRGGTRVTRQCQRPQVAGSNRLAGIAPVLPPGRPLV